MRVCCIPAGTGGVAFYRMWQPYRWLQKQGEEVFVFDPKRHDSHRLEQEQMQADIIVYQCPWSEGILQAAQVIKGGKTFGNNKKIVVELDDNLFDVDPWNEKYNMFGIREHFIHIDKNDTETQQTFIKAMNDEEWCRKTKLPDGTLQFDMWRDGYRDFSIEENKRKYDATVKLLNIVDLITVTTKELGKAIRKIAPKTRIAVLPNLIDPDRYLPMKNKNDGFLRIGWQGGSAHFDDLRLVIDPLKEIYDKHKGVKFVFKGVQFDAIVKEFKDRVEWQAWHGDIATYPLDVRDMCIDIGIAPLQQTNFNKGKSPIKWIEYSQMGIPTVASPVVYGDHIKHGKTGFVANNSKQWVEYLDLLIKDVKKRKEVAKNAYEHIQRKFSVDKSVLWKNALRDIMSPCQKKIILPQM